jgi:hydrogenase expression/formation protein HypC
MCLAVPGKILEVIRDAPLARLGKVDFEGVRKEINLSFVPEAGAGDYVLVHVGFAIARLDEREAARVFEYLKRTEDLRELEG